MPSDPDAGDTSLPIVGRFPAASVAFAAAIDRWEGLWQDDPNDSGNYAHLPDGRTVLVGTMRGVTPDTYARFKGIPVSEVTPDMMKQDITAEVASRICWSEYYLAQGYAKLTFSPLLVVDVDIGWGSGPGRGIKMLQQLVGADADGVIGPQTVAAYESLIRRRPIEPLVERLCDLRQDFYEQISQPGSPNAKYRNGWLRRADWFRPCQLPPCWWDAWRGWTPDADPAAQNPEGGDASAPEYP